VVGPAAARLLTADLIPAQDRHPDHPARADRDRAAADPAAESLRRAFVATDPAGRDAREQAELLATCADRRTLRLVAGALAAACGGTLAG
jgi:hypothetical protein